MFVINHIIRSPGPVYLMVPSHILVSLFPTFSNITVQVSLIISIGFFSILITYSLNHEYLGMWNIVLIVFHILSIITFFSVLGIILGLFINSRILIINIYIILFAILSIGMGVFIPINNYPLSYVEFVKNIPLFMVFQNMQSIIIHEDIQWIGLFINAICSLLLFFISVVASNKIFRKI